MADTEKNPENFEKEDWDKFLKSIENRVRKLSRERYGAIVSCVILEEALEEVLAEFLIEGKQSDQLLHGILTFSTKITLAYSLGLIGRDEHDDLHIMRQIRNRFAHGPQERSFEDEAIKLLCDSLKTIKKNPGEETSNFQLHQSSEAILRYILSERAFYAGGKRCLRPKEFDPSRWSDM
ncbi:MAG: DUF4145 domain-containing protein [Blastocatellia bacterium]